ncbi:acyltransferase [Wenyingzhuangia sp. 2_MG-2023]|uniref:acyltransferase n=1 Tax=Wenyingzhuangia sp. 2_MG-2023 TaxID=3062639 RepID=UPI0026E2F43A|nr:acyltransferase [Wenyingzhuangia sp. 2_MG-2023]MDO6739308.1 acyltransferase [Wenyingzhuangia sp. 2_MG-2023]
MEEIKDSKYKREIQQRSLLRYLKGLYPRYKNYLKYKRISSIARKKGAFVGNNVTMPISLAKKANSNLTIGNNTSIQTDKLDLRAKVTIGHNVVIGKDVEILTNSHNVDSLDWEHKSYGIEIEDYVWLATRVFVLPSCRKIAYGTVCAAGAVVVKSTEDMDIVSGNPAKFIRKRKVIHSNLCVESLLSNDYEAYVDAYKDK